MGYNDRLDRLEDAFGSNDGEREPAAKVRAARARLAHFRVRCALAEVGAGSGPAPEEEAQALQDRVLVEAWDREHPQDLANRDPRDVLRARIEKIAESLSL